MPRFQAALLGAREVSFHRAVDEPVARRRLHSDPADGRHRRAPLPRVRHDAVDRDPGVVGGVADHDADDVRAPSARQAGTPAGPAVARVRTRLQFPACGYERTLGSALSHPRTTMLTLLAVLGLNFVLYATIPKGFFPQQDTGRLIGGIQADQSISFQLMRQKLTQFISIVQEGSGRRERGRLHRRRADELRLRVRLLEAALRAQALGRRGDRATAPRVGASAGCGTLPPGRAGHPDRRPAEQRRVPIHAPGRQSVGPLRMGAEADRGAPARARAVGRQLRSAAERP